MAQDYGFQVGAEMGPRSHRLTERELGAVLEAAGFNPYMPKPLRGCAGWVTSKAASGDDFPEEPFMVNWAFDEDPGAAVGKAMVQAYAAVLAAAGIEVEVAIDETDETAYGQMLFAGPTRYEVQS